MLVTGGGETAGVISGGCLEGDVRERALEVMSSGHPCLVTYDSTAPDDIVFGLGLGCKGVVKILIERLFPGDDRGLLAFFEDCIASRRAGSIATVFQSASVPCGTRVLRWPDGRVTSTHRDSAVTEALIGALTVNSDRRTAAGRVDLPGETSAGILTESVAPPVSLTIFGGGDDAVPLVRLAKSIGWSVAVIDARPRFATPERFPEADVVECLHPEALRGGCAGVVSPESVVMLMTHNFAHDKVLLDAILPTGPRYVGVLGPRSRTKSLLDELDYEEWEMGEGWLDRIHGPAGLDIGAETPEEIAVSILAEMQAVLARRAGGYLRERALPIHDRCGGVILPT